MFIVPPLYLHSYPCQQLTFCGQWRYQIWWGIISLTCLDNRRAASENCVGPLLHILVAPVCQTMCFIMQLCEFYHLSSIRYRLAETRRMWVSQWRSSASFFFPVLYIAMIVPHVYTCTSEHAHQFQYIPSYSSSWLCSTLTTIPCRNFRN